MRNISFPIWFLFHKVVMEHVNLLVTPVLCVAAFSAVPTVCLYKCKQIERYSVYCKGEGNNT